MYNVFRLLKNYVLNFLGSFLKKFKTPKFYIAVLLCLLFSCSIVFTFTMNAISSIQIYIDQKIENPELLAMFSTTTLALMMLLFVTIMRSVYPSKGNDHEMLLSMPIKKIEIVIAKSIYNYLFDLLIFLGILMPSYIVFYVMIPEASFYVVTRGFVFVLILPFISNAIASFVGILTDKASRMFKRYTIIQTVITILLIASYLILNYSLQNYLIKATGNAKDIIESIFIIDYVLDFVLYGQGVNLIMIIVVAAILYVSSLLYTSSQYGKLQKERKIEHKELIYKCNSVVGALTKKEIKQYFNTPIYLINTIVPMVIYIGLAVAASFLGKEFALSFVSMLPSSFLVNFDVLVLMIFCLLVSGCVTTGSSISLEGKHYWIIRSNPIKSTSIFASKILTNLIVTTVCVIVAFPFIATFVEIVNVWWFIVVPVLTSLMASTMGLVVNLIYPKLEWDREEAVVKSSIASLISLFFPMILTLIPFVIFMVSLTNILSGTSFVFFVSMYQIIITLLLFLWLKHRGENALYSASLNKN